VRVPEGQTVGLAEAHDRLRQLLLTRWFIVTRQEEYERMSVFNFVDEHGTRMLATDPLPAGVRRGRAHNCFANAFRLAAARGWAYAEGYGVIHGIPVHHAWCVADAGHVVDPTWRFEAGREYVGLTMTVAAAARLMERGWRWGVLDPTFGWPHILDAAREAEAELDIVVQGQAPSQQRKD
jgi:hypothetical protein